MWNNYTYLTVSPNANVSIIVNGFDDYTNVGFPLTIKNDGKKYYYYEAYEDLDSDGNVINYSCSTITDFSIIIDNTYIISNESINDFPYELNGKIYSAGNIRCLVVVTRSYSF